MKYFFSWFASVRHPFALKGTAYTGEPGDDVLHRVRTAKEIRLSPVSTRMMKKAVATVVVVISISVKAHSDTVAHPMKRRVAACLVPG
jgi:hypothetical protein